MLGTEKTRNQSRFQLLVGIRMTICGEPTLAMNLLEGDITENTEHLASQDSFQLLERGHVVGRRISC
jgi:hypothetical protein